MKRQSGVVSRCEYCGEVCSDEYVDDVIGESFHACSDWHAELYLYEQHCHSEIEEEATA